MGLKAMVIDAWSWLNYKPLFSDPALGMPNRRAFPEAHATWVPAEDERRLAAYKLLAAYDQNQAGELAEVRDGASARERREFGDPSMFIDTLVSHVLGREQHIVVPGAEQTGDQDGPDTTAAARVQELLREWAEEELLPMRMLQGERKAVGLGDGVYLLYWDGGKRRVRMKVYDPGFYFPIIGEDDDGSVLPGHGLHGGAGADVGGLCVSHRGLLHELLHCWPPSRSRLIGCHHRFPSPPPQSGLG